jgi:hypothetical protein
MRNNTIIYNTQPVESDPLIVAYYPLFLMVVGTLLNFLTFLILCQLTFKHTRKQPTIHYMRAIAIYVYSLLNHTVLSCKLDLYFSYSISQIFSHFCLSWSIFIIKLPFIVHGLIDLSQLHWL